MFLCDAICAEADGDVAAKRARELMHPTAREAGEMAARADTGQLVCTHIGRFGNADRVVAEAGRAFGGKVTLPSDGTAFDI